MDGTDGLRSNRLSAPSDLIAHFQGPQFNRCSPPPLRAVRRRRRRGLEREGRCSRRGGGSSARAALERLLRTISLLFLSLRRGWLPTQRPTPPRWRISTSTASASTKPRTNPRSVSFAEPSSTPIRVFLSGSSR